MLEEELWPAEWLKVPCPFLHLLHKIRLAPPPFIHSLLLCQNSSLTSRRLKHAQADVRDILSAISFICPINFATAPPCPYKVPPQKQWWCYLHYQTHHQNVEICLLFDFWTCILTNKFASRHCEYYVDFAFPSLEKQVRWCKWAFAAVTQIGKTGKVQNSSLHGCQKVPLCANRFPIFCVDTLHICRICQKV